MALFKRSRKRRKPKNTATRSAPIMRYYTADSGDKPAKRAERIQKETEGVWQAKLSRFMKQLPQRLVFVAILVLLFVNTTLSSAVIKVDQSDTRYRSDERYRQGVSDIFDSSLLYKSKVTLSSQKFEDEVRQKFPEVAQAVAVVPLAGRDLQVSLRFTNPLLRITTQDNQQGIIGERGTFILLDDLATPTSFDQIPVLTLQEQPELEQGTQLLTSVETELISLLLAEFDGSVSHLHPVRSILFDVKRREMQVRFDDVSYYAKVTPEREAREQVGALIASLEQLYDDKNLPNTYVDVRVEGRIFVR